ncbi:MAG: hypothetical protein AABX11_02385 [Nanoarchaeota archaeon]
MSLEMDLALANAPSKNEESIKRTLGKSLWSGFRSLFFTDQPKPQTLKEFLSDVSQPPIVPYIQLTPELRAKADALKSKFPQWNDWGHYQSGNIKDVFVAQPVFDSASQKHIIFAVKMDKPESEVVSVASPAMLKHYRKEYNSRREASMAIETSGLTGFSSPVEGRDLSDVGYLGCYAYAEQFVPSASLQQILEQKKTLPVHIATHYARKMFEQSQAFFARTGHLHRDLKPSNLLVALGGRQGDLVITDTSAAGRPNEEVDEFTHSCPGRKTCDPRLMGARTGKASKYDQASEVYSLTKMFGMMLLGEDFLPVSPYDSNPFDENEYDKMLSTALDRLPENAKDYKELLYDGLRYDSKRIPTLMGLVKRLDCVEKPSTWQKVKKHWVRNSLIALTGLVALGAGTNIAINNSNALNYARQLMGDEQKTILLDADWDGNNRLVPSALFDMKARADCYDRASTNDQHYPSKTKLILAKPGDIVTVTGDILQRPLPSRNLRVPYLVYPIKVSVEGTTNIPSEEFNSLSTNPKSVSSRGYPPGGQFNKNFASLRIPTNMPAGNYTIIVNAFPPKEVNSRDDIDFIIKANGTNALVEERIPLIVGKMPSEVLRVSKVQFSYLQNEIQFDTFNPTNGLLNGLEYNFRDNYEMDCRIPELNYSQVNWPHLVTLPLPGGTNIPVGNYTFLLDIRDKASGKKVLSTAYPLKYGPLGGYKLLDWDLARPPREFTEKVARYRSQLEASEQKTAQRTN